MTTQGDGDRFSLRKWDLFEDSRLPDQIVKLIGWRTGVVKRIFQCGVELGDPRLFQIILMHAGIERLVGLSSRVNLRAAGAGFSFIDAFYRAIGEVVERYALHFYDDDTIVYDSYRNLVKQGRQVVSPEIFRLFSDAQLVPGKAIFYRFHEDMPLGWTEGVSFITGEPILVPAQMIYFSYKLRPGEKRITYASSSGCACASSLEEALLRGIYECVERDAVMITWYARISPPALNVDASALLRNLYETRYSEQGQTFNLRYISLDIDLPVVMGIADLTLAGRRRRFVGAACRLSAEDAAFKALLEMGQGVPFIKYNLLRVPFPSYDQLEYRDFDDNVRYYVDPAHVDKLDFLLASDEVVSLDQLPNRHTGDVKTDLRTAVGVLEKHDLEAIAFDHTTEDMRDLGFHVGRMLVPELMPLGTPADPFLGNPRLYEVPVRLHKMAEVKVNPDLHPFP